MILRSLNNCVLRLGKATADSSAMLRNDKQKDRQRQERSRVLRNLRIAVEEVLRLIRLVGRGGLGAGGEEGEDGAAMEGMLGAAEGETAVVAGYDAGGDPEAEAGAVEILGGVEGLEETGADGGGDAVAGVGDGDADALARLSGGVVRGVVGADEEAATVAHGVDGVGDKVVEDLADVVFEAGDFGRGGVGGFDLDAGVGEAALIEVEHGVDEIGCADAGGADGLAVKAEGLG